MHLFYFMHRGHVNNGRSRGNVGTRSLTPLKKRGKKIKKNTRASVGSSISISIGWIVFLSHPTYLPTYPYESRVRNSATGLLFVPTSINRKAPSSSALVVGLLSSDIENRRKEQCARSRSFVRQTTVKRNTRVRRYLDTPALT